MKQLILITGFVLILSVFAAQATTYEDMLSRQITIDHKPHRIVCVGPGALRLIVYLQAEKLVVGVEDIEKRFSMGRPYRMAHPELANLPSIGPGGPQSINTKPDLEAILKLHPDVIFATYMDKTVANSIQQLTGIPVVVLSYGSKENLESHIEKSLLLAGKILGKETRALDVTDYIEILQKDIRRRIASASSKRKQTVYVGGVGYRGSHGIESTELYYIPFVWAGINNIAASVTSRIGSHIFVDKEILLSLDPDVIFIDAGGLKLILEDYKKHPAFYHALRALSSGKIYLLFPFNYYTTNLETALVNAYAVGKILFPEQFQDVNLKTKADEIFTFFVGSPIYEAMKRAYGPLGHSISLLKSK